MHDTLVAHMRQVINLSATDVEIIERLFKPSKLDKGEYFLKEGKVCRHIGFINKGLLRYYINQEGEEKTFSFGYEGCFFTDYESFIPQVPSMQNIEALEQTEILTISYPDLQLFYQSIAGAERFGRVAMEYVFIDTLQDLKSFYADEKQLRYQKFIARYPAIVNRVPQYHIASYIGIKPQSLSRIRKRMAS